MAKILADRFKTDDKLTVTEVGFDEAGRGCFFGPIMAGAVIWPHEENWTEEVRELASKTKDSKKLSPKRRTEYAAKIRQHIQFWGVGQVDADEINDRGIQWANREAFRRALAEVWQKLGAAGSATMPASIRLIVDGAITFWNTDGVPMPYPIQSEELVVEGDGKFLSVAAASILAKVAHDDWIQNWIGENAEAAERYDMVGSKGYGTAKHREGLKKWGTVGGHRTLFVRNWVPAGSWKMSENNSERYAATTTTVIPAEEEKCLIQIPIPRIHSRQLKK
jgi:ribonuclease HII